jgi:hypothetical protein
MYIIYILHGRFYKKQQLKQLLLLIMSEWVNNMGGNENKLLFFYVYKLIFHPTLNNYSLLCHIWAHIIYSHKQSTDLTYAQNLSYAAAKN